MSLTRTPAPSGPARGCDLGSRSCGVWRTRFAEDDRRRKGAFISGGLDSRDRRQNVAMHPEPGDLSIGSTRGSRRRYEVRWDPLTDHFFFPGGGGGGTSASKVGWRACWTTFPRYMHARGNAITERLRIRFPDGRRAATEVKVVLSGEGGARSWRLPEYAVEHRLGKTLGFVPAGPRAVEPPSIRFRRLQWARNARRKRPLERHAWGRGFSPPSARTAAAPTSHSRAPCLKRGA